MYVTHRHRLAKPMTLAGPVVVLKDGLDRAAGLAATISNYERHADERSLAGFSRCAGDDFFIPAESLPCRAGPRACGLSDGRELSLRRRARLPHGIGAPSCPVRPGEL